jgi:hypothetical protein
MNHVLIGSGLITIKKKKKNKSRLLLYENLSLVPKKYGTLSVHILVFIQMEIIDTNTRMTMVKESLVLC